MDRSVAQGRSEASSGDGRTEPDTKAERRLAIVAGLLLALVAFVVFMATQTERYYDHFVWQAAAFLEGQAAIRYPVESSAGSIGNAFFQDVLPVATADGVARGLIPFPPLPALLLVPFVAMFGPTADDQTIFTALAAIDVAICWWMLGRLRIPGVVRLGTTVFFAFGTVFWYSAQLATTWYQAHIVAVGLAMLAVGLALGADAAAQDDEPFPEPEERRGPSGWHVRLAIDPRQFAIGLLFGLACTARLTVVFAAPFFMLVGSGGSWWRRSWSAGLGAAIPVAALLAYNIATTGHVFHPAYDHLYRLEARAYTALGYELSWSVEDPRYLPQNLRIMFLSTPEILPDRLRDTLGTIDEPLCGVEGATRGLFDPDCPLALPNDVGMSVLLTSPAFLLMLPAIRRYGRSRLVTGASLAVLFIVVVNLMHFSQGWVQFGYRFSNDAVPFGLPLVAIGFAHLVERGRRRAWAMPAAVVLIVISIGVNAWGVAWGRLLGW